MNEGIKEFLENFLTKEEKIARAKLQLEKAEQEAKDWKDALDELEEN